MPTADRNGRKTIAQKLLETARQLMVTIATSYFDLGSTFNALLEHDLYKELGTYLSFRHFLRKEGLVPYSTAQRFMRIARTYQSPAGRKLGVSKALALIRLAAWEGASPDDLVTNDTK